MIAPSACILGGLICIFAGMEIRNIYQPFELDILEISEYTAQYHKNTFFEMIFVLEGEGVQIVNDHRLPYSPNKLFLIFPSDRHGFEVTKPTKFLFIRFNNNYLKTQSKEWVQKVEYIFHNHNHLPGCVLANVSDKPLVKALAEAIIVENESRFPKRGEVISQFINTIITIAARNISVKEPAIATGTANDALSLINYIHRNIFLPDKLRADIVAAHFHVSQNYIGEYFKKNTGENMQQYIALYKMKLIETRLKYTNMRLKEISDEFGFTDLSHLNRIFKKYNGLSPTEFRRNHLVTEE